MKSKKSKIISFSVLMLSIIFVIYFTRNHLGELRQIISINWYDIIFLGALTLFVTAGNGIKNKLLVQPFGVHLSRLEWFGLSVVNTFWNYLPFQGGLIAKGVYLKKRHKFPYPDYISIASASYIITFIILGLVGCVGVIILHLTNGLFSISIVWGYGVLAVVSLAVLFYIRWHHSIRWFPRFSKRIYSGIRIIFSQRTLVFKLVCIDVLIVLLYTVRLYVASNALGYDISILFYFLVSPVALLAIFTSITPGGLVIRESLIALFATWLSVNVTESVIAAVLDRGISIALILILGVVFNYYLSKKLSMQKVTESTE